MNNTEVCHSVNALCDIMSPSMRDSIKVGVAQIYKGE